MSNENSSVEYESGVSPTAMSAITDSGDKTTFTTGATLFSANGSSSPVVRPNGVLTGAVISPAISGSDDLVDISACTVNLNGVEVTVPASTDVAITRAATNVAVINTLTITSGGAYAMIKGTDSSDATLNEVYGSAGGPPFVDTDAVMVGQIRVVDDTAAPITNSEILQVFGTHLEKAESPGFTIDNFNAEIVFNSSLISAHTGSLAKAVFASYAEPIFTEQSFSNDFVPVETTNTASSEQVYGSTVGTATSALSQGSFTAILTDGITDDIISKKNQNLFFRYTQDSSKTPNILTQGIFGIVRSFAADDNPKIACTITAKLQSVERAS